MDAGHVTLLVSVMSDLWMEDSATFMLWHGTSTVNKDGSTGVPNEYYFDNAATII